MTCFIVDCNRNRISMTNDEIDLWWNSIEGEVSDFSTDTEEEIKKAKEKENKKTIMMYQTRTIKKKDNVNTIL